MTKASKKREARRAKPSTSVGINGDGGHSPTSEDENPAVSSQGAVSEKGRPGSVNDGRRCTATANRTGERCRMAAIKGGTVCRIHGGSTPAVKKKAAERLEEARQELMDMVEPALKQLRTIVEEAGTSDADKLRAIGMVLNRTGLSERHTLDIVPRPETPWDALAGEGIDMNPDMGELLAGAGEAEHEVRRSNLHQLQASAQDDIDRERYDEEAAEYAERPRFNNGQVVQGEVVDARPPTRSPDTGPITYEGETAWSDPRTGSEHDPSPYRGPYDREPDAAPDDPPRYARGR